MYREMIIACLPYLGAILVSLLVLRLLLWFFQARLRLAQIFCLHRDEQGGVQSLSFVLTLPLFVMILMFIVQLSQITIGRIAVEYAAYSAARSAMVWIPASTGAGLEQENQISTRTLVREFPGNGEEVYYVYRVAPEGDKFAKIHFAAAMACMSICPSRDLNIARDHPGNDAVDSLKRVYRSLFPSSEDNTRSGPRIENKLAYALENTYVSIEVHHKEDHVETPLVRYPLLDRSRYAGEFMPNEFGWQDQIYVTVKHDFALLPGPGRLLARRADARPGTSAEEAPGNDEIARNIKRRSGAYVYPLEATVRLGNEGQKSVLPYIQRMRGGTSYSEVPQGTDDDDYYEYDEHGFEDEHEDSDDGEEEDDDREMDDGDDGEDNDREEREQNDDGPDESPNEDRDDEPREENGDKPDLEDKDEGPADTDEDSDDGSPRQQENEGGDVDR